MNFNDLTLEPRGPQTGLALFDDGNYIATYVSAQDCITDLSYRFHVHELDKVICKFGLSPNTFVEAPATYRGVCSEMFLPTNTISRYVYYGNKLSDIFEKFEFHEKRAILHKEHFLYGVQGTGIHIFNPINNSYEFWVGGDLKSVSDVMFEVRKNGLDIPTKLKEEYALHRSFDVFISHKSTSFTKANEIYEFLTEKNFKVFLSEISLPALSNADYTSEIDSALEQTRNMIVIADSIENLMSGWVKYEWESFLNEKRSGRKTGNIIVVRMPDITIDNLPYSLRQVENIPFDSYRQVVDYIV